MMQRSARTMMPVYRYAFVGYNNKIQVLIDSTLVLHKHNLGSSALLPPVKTWECHIVLVSWVPPGFLYKEGQIKNLLTN
jgi:hypothetical protein